MRLTSPLLFIAFFFINNAQASGTNVYKNTNKQGEVEFTDKPSSHSKKIHVSPMNTFDSDAQPKPTATKKVKPNKPLYSNFVINSPANDSPVRANAGNITIIVGFEPPLKTGHSIKVVLDGNSETSVTGKSTNIFMRNVNRGTHSVQAFILDENGYELAQSNSTIFHLLRYTSVPHRNTNPQPPKINIPVKSN